jgi:hypothetical protein
MLLSCTYRYFNFIELAVTILISRSDVRKILDHYCATGTPNTFRPAEAYPSTRLCKFQVEASIWVLSTPHYTRFVECACSLR